MVANPGSKTYGAMTVAIQFRSEVKIAFDVSPESFLPRPEVTSSVVVCDVRESPIKVSDEDFFVKVVRASFGQRRKTILNSLAGAGFPREKILAAAKLSGISPGDRAENLSIENFATLSENLRQV